VTVSCVITIIGFYTSLEGDICSFPTDKNGVSRKLLEGIIVGADKKILKMESQRDGAKEFGQSSTRSERSEEVVSAGLSWQGFRHQTGSSPVRQSREISR
jgi:hypothetical protein